MILEVVVPEDNQANSSSMITSGSTLVNAPSSTSSNVGRVSGGQSLVASSSSQVGSVARDVAALRITEAGDNQTLVVRSRGHSSGNLLKGLSTSSTGHLQLGTESNMTLQTLKEQLHQLQQQKQQSQRQMEEILGKIQQTDQQAQRSQQQVQHNIEEIVMSNGGL